MGLFGLFSKKKKETLDEGLAKSKENVFTKIARAVAGRTTIDDSVLDELEDVLVTSDVGVERMELPMGRTSLYQPIRSPT